MPTLTTTSLPACLLLPASYARKELSGLRFFSSISRSTFAVSTAIISRSFSLDTPPLALPPPLVPPPVPVPVPLALASDDAAGAAPLPSTVLVAPLMPSSTLTRLSWASAEVMTCWARRGRLEARGSNAVGSQIRREPVGGASQLGGGGWYEVDGSRTEEAHSESRE